MSQRVDRQCWIRVLLFLSGTVGLVYSQDQTGRSDILIGVNGENSCQLRNTIHSSCNSTISPPPLNTTPIASPCTCNKVYFNIWSACSYASGNNTLPSFDQWTSTCTENAIDLTESASKASSNGGIGITVPAWGNLDVPGNTSFDLQKAVEVVVQAKSSRWTAFQILAPVISALVAILLTFTFIYLFRSRLTHFRVRSSRARDFFRPIRRVKNVSNIAPEGWVIEQGDTPTRVAPPPMHDPLSPIETNRETIITIPGNPSIPPSSDRLSGDFPDKSNHEIHGVGSSKVPGGRVYPFASLQQPVPLSQPTTTDTSRKTSTVSLVDWARGMHIHMPWRSGPVPVTVTSPNEEFTMDSSSRPSGGMSTDTISSFACRGQDNPRPSFDMVRQHEDNEDNIDLEEHTEDLGSDEGTSLITDKEHGPVIVIGRRKRKSRSSGTKSSDQHSSSIHSSVKIVSPSNSTSSPRDSNPGSIFFSWPWARPLVPVPPVPTRPAPLPPPVQKAAKPRNSALGTSSNSHPLPIPPNRAMSPIQEDSSFDSDFGGDWRRSPSPIRPPLAIPRTEQIARSVPAAPPVSMARRPSAENPRPLPLPTSAALSSASQSEHLNSHLRSDSHTFSGSVLYEEYANAHSRSGSVDSNASSSQLRPGQRSLTAGSRPLPTPTSTPRPPAQHLPSAHAVYTHQASGSISAASLASSTGAHSVVQFRDPFAQAVGHARGLDVDDGASFYLTPYEVPDPVRSPPPLDEVVGDPGMLFPSSVRGAGYRGTPN